MLYVVQKEKKKKQKVVYETKLKKNKRVQKESIGEACPTTAQLQVTDLIVCMV